MTQQFVTGRGHGEDDSAEDPTAQGGQTFASVQGSDDLLDEIDAVLETNAETFVRSFVQKGGE